MERMISAHRSAQGNSGSVKRYFIFAVLALTAAIMISNSFRHPTRWVYDPGKHREVVDTNLPFKVLIPKRGQGHYDYNPPLYYYLIGKTKRILDLPFDSDLDPVNISRVYHILFIFLIAGLFIFRLAPKTLGITDTRKSASFAMSLFIIPNLYLTQIMIRPDHLLFLILNLLFFIWFYYDFPEKLSKSRWRLAAWGILLVGLANTRHLAFPAFVVFFLWGFLIIFKKMREPSSGKHFVKIGLFLTVIVGLSSAHYIKRYLDTGYLVRINRNYSQYLQNYYQRQMDFDRSKLFFNFQFDKLLEIPNRYADFRDRNAFLPRLYGDMWADHWLYFSGPKLSDTKIGNKRLVLVLASVFALLYFLLPLGGTFKGIQILRSGRQLSMVQTASILWVAAFLCLIAFVNHHPEVGKNSTVKFCFLIGYSWLPLIVIADFFKRKPRLGNFFLAYQIILFLVCIPLYFY